MSLLFDREDIPRSKSKKLMHVYDADEGIIIFQCKHCGHNTDWIEDTQTVTENKRGIPCPKCNDTPKD